MTKGQAEVLIPLIDDVLSDAGMSVTELERIGVGVGPGNFTGIRIAVSTARGLALSLGIPAVGVSKFDAYALEAPRPALISIAAPRETYYVQEVHEDWLSDPIQTSVDEFRPSRDADFTCVGNDEIKFAEKLGCKHGPAQFYPALAIARIAASSPPSKFEPPKPFYFREPDAAPSKIAPPIILK